MPAPVKKERQRMQERVVLQPFQQFLGEINRIVLGRVVTRPLANHPRPDCREAPGGDQVIGAADLEHVAFPRIGNAKAKSECPEREVYMGALIGMPVGQKERNIETMGILVFKKLVQIEGLQIEFFLHNMLVSMFLFVAGGGHCRYRPPK